MGIGIFSILAALICAYICDNAYKSMAYIIILVISYYLGMSNGYKHALTVSNNTTENTYTGETNDIK